jgi:hypothetical protein
MTSPSFPTNTKDAKEKLNRVDEEAEKTGLKIIRIYHEYPYGIREISPEGLNISVRDEACLIPD